MTLTAIEWVGLVVSGLFAFVVCGKICSKVGYSRWLGLVMAIPFVNIVALIMFAYSTWPIESKLMGSESQEAPLAEKHGYLRGPRDRAPF